MPHGLPAPSSSSDAGPVVTASARFFPGPVGAQDPGGDDRPAELTGAEEGSGVGEAQGGVIAPLQL